MGAAVPPMPPMPPRPDDSRRTRSAVAVLVVGVLSVVLFFPFGPILGAMAIATGRRARTAMQGVPGRGLATAGVVLGWIGLVSGAAFFVIAATCECL